MMKKSKLFILLAIIAVVIIVLSVAGSAIDVNPTTATPKIPSATATSKPLFSRCQTCGGRGGCPAYCEHGYETCWECLGSGTDFCDGLYCLSGVCSECLGSGEIDEYDFHGGIRTRRCSYCSGTGECRICRGSGTSTCHSCNGRGAIRCATCSGTGRCPTCGK